MIFWQHQKSASCSHGHILAGLRPKGLCDKKFASYLRGNFMAGLYPKGLINPPPVRSTISWPGFARKA